MYYIYIIQTWGTRGIQRVLVRHHPKDVIHTTQCSKIRKNYSTFFYITIFSILSEAKELSGKQSYIGKEKQKLQPWILQFFTFLRVVHWLG